MSRSHAIYFTRVGQTKTGRVAPEPVREAKADMLRAFTERVLNLLLRHHTTWPARCADEITLWAKRMLEAQPEPQQQGEEGVALCPFCSTYPQVDNDHDGPGCTFECCTDECPVNPSIYCDNEPDVFGYNLARLEWNEMAERPLLWAAQRLLHEAGPYSQRDDTPCCRSEDMAALRAAVAFTEGEKAAAEAAFDRRIARALAAPAPAAPAGVTEAMVEDGLRAYIKAIEKRCSGVMHPDAQYLDTMRSILRPVIAAALAAAGNG